MKNLILLLGSLCFYAWGKPLYLLPMVFSVASDFIHGILIDKHRGKSTAKILLSSALFFDLTLLFVFGYADFFIETINLFWDVKLAKFGFSMPIGITIYTLQTISYVIDVYRGKCSSARNFFEYAAYVTMFPQLPAGPVVRYVEVKDDILGRKVNLHQISFGAKRICVGLAKKIIIADAAGQLWTTIFATRPVGMSAATAWLGVFAYAFHMYFAFSGYADVAIGLGACMGFSFPENFDHPFIARSITDFIRRWNMSLTRWMKEYFYRPILGKGKGKIQKIFWILVTWGLIGLWYGPDWTFVLWGLWIAVFYVVEKLFLEKILSLLPYIFGWCYAMLVITVGWLLLAMNELTDALSYAKTMFGSGEHGLIDQRFFFLALENLPMLVLGVVFSLPLFSGMVKRLEQGRNGFAIAITRLLEKIYPPICLLAALVYLVGRQF
ncbi:MAG: MBOAT family protein [Lachnospiraceae bacterium]|nr:MBOAT family protein [Lachnospiraceae bacterium]